MRTPEVFKAKQDIDVFVRQRVTGIDPDNRVLHVTDLSSGASRTERYDRLILATGARSRRPGLPGQDAANFFTLKDLNDAVRIKAHVERRAPARAVILGSGYIGLEMAEALRSRGLETTIVYRGKRPASRLEPELSDRILQELDAHGVQFLAEHVLEGFETGGEGEISAVRTSQGPVAADLVLCALGVEPRTGLAVAAGVDLGSSGAIRTDRRQATNLPGVFTAGDCCEAYHRVLEAWVHMPLGDVATKQGRVAGENAAGGSASFAGVIGSQGFQVFDLEIASTGLTEGEARACGKDVAVQVIQGFSRVHYMPGAERLVVKLVVEKPSGRLLGAHMAGKEGVGRRINVLALTVQARMTVGDLADADFAYAPTFSPPLDPILVAAEQSLKSL